MTDDPNKPDLPAPAGDAPDAASTKHAPPAQETPDERKARLVNEAKQRAATAKETATAKTGTPPPSAPGGAGNLHKAPVKKKEEGPKPADASAHPLVEKLRAKFNEEIVEATLFLGQLSVRVAPASIVAVCAALKNDAETPFDMLTDVSAVHWPERAETPFEVVYNLYSIKANARVRLKVLTNEEAGVESVTSVWPAANWPEREVYDLFGVAFHNHPDLRRLLLPPDWQGHPLRKEYPLKPVENEWTRKHLPPFDAVQQEQLEQRRGYGLEILSHPDERRIREIFIAGREVMPLDRK